MQNKIGVGLLCASLAIAMGGSLLEGVSLGEVPTLAVIFFVYIFLIIMISQGKNWARNILAVVFAIHTFLFLVLSAKADFYFSLVGLVIFLQAVALVLLFLAPGKLPGQEEK
jgi:hypothetical protein